MLLLKMVQFEYQLFSPDDFKSRGEIKKRHRCFLFMVKAILGERSEIKNVVAAISTRSKTSSFNRDSDITSIQSYASLTE